MVKAGVKVSSNRYKIRKEGKAIKIKMIPGTIVQIISINWFSRKNRLIIPLFMMEIMM